jgi:26S proteasome regulatory subunit T5
MSKIIRRNKKSQKKSHKNKRRSRRQNGGSTSATTYVGNIVGGLDKQIQELIEAIVLPMTHAERFESIGIRAPKGVLLWGPPGTGKTLLARACAKNTDAIFLKLAGPQLVQMYIGDGAKLVRDAFDLAKEKIANGSLMMIHRLKKFTGKQEKSNYSYSKLQTIEEEFGGDGNDSNDEI